MRDRRLRRQFLRFRDRGDYAALTEVFDGTAPALLGLATHLVRPPLSPEDLVQTTFLTVIEGSQGYDPTRPLYPWLAGILVHKARHAQRREGRVIDPARLVDRPGEDDPAHAAHRLELSATLSTAVAELPETYRGVLERWFERGAGPRQIARELGLEPGTVRVRLHRGLTRLRRSLPEGARLCGALVLSPTTRLAPVRELVSTTAQASSSSLAASLTSGATGGLTLMSSLPTLPLLAATLTVAAASSFFVASEYPDPIGSLGAHRAAAQTAVLPPSPHRQAALQPEQEPTRESVALDAPIPPPVRATPAPPPWLAPPAGEPTTGPLPPSMVALPGGRTQVGSSVADLQEVIGGDDEAARMLRAIDVETPKHTVTVPPFHIARTEVTNEQYAAFLRATGHRPPVSFAGPELEGARREFLASQRSVPLLDRQKFDEETWWTQSWQSASWSIPTSKADHPVVNVTYQDAEAYARWAGLRLPSEQEFQHAARGKSDRFYPWGDDWVEGNAMTNRTRPSTTSPVGTYPDGKTAEGVHDLSGNVWEWTTSAFVAHPGFERNEYHVRGQREPVLAPVPHWDARMRVLTSGSYQNSPMAARVTVRRGAEVNQATNAVGFRVAASQRRGEDIARWATADLERQPTNLPDFDPSGVHAIDRWWVLATQPGAPEGYAVVGGYQHVAFVPVTPLEMTSWSELPEGQGIALGFLSTSEALADPAVPGGVHVVVLAPGEEAPELSLVEPVTGEVLLRIPAPGAAFTKDDQRAGLTRSGDRLELRLRVPTRIRRRVLAVDVSLDFVEGALNGVWNE